MCYLHFDGLVSVKTLRRWGIRHFEVTVLERNTSMLSYAQGARQRYVAHLEAEKQKQTSVDSDCNAKQNLKDDERDKQKAKKQRLDSDIAALMKSSDELADSAETKDLLDAAFAVQYPQ